MNQTLAFQTNGVVDLDRAYGGAGASWAHAMRVNGRPLRWTVGVEADRSREHRKGFDNLGGNEGTLRRNEYDSAGDADVFGQLDWAFAPGWKLAAGIRSSTVRFKVDDRFHPATASNSGSVKYTNTSPSLGLMWHARDTLNLYANLGTGFETPTLSEIAYRPDGEAGPNFVLKPSRSTQGEIGMKWRSGRHVLDAALFDAVSHDEIVPQSSGGRAIYQNADRVRRRGVEASWRADWGPVATRIGYTLLDARFTAPYRSTQATVPAGSRLPGAPMHSLFADVERTLAASWKATLELRADSATKVNDLNTEQAPGYAVLNASIGKELCFQGLKLMLYGRFDNLLDKHYAGSVIVNETNGRYYEPAPGRRFFVGVRSQF